MSIPKLIKKHSSFLAVMSMAAMLALPFATPAVVSAAATSCSVGSTASSLSISQGADCANPGTTSKSLFGNGGLFEAVSHFLIFLVGGVSVIMLIIGGFLYVISAGDSKRVTSAKDTILYAIIGLVVAIISYAAVDFVVSQFSN